MELNTLLPALFGGDGRGVIAVKSFHKEII